MRLTPYGACAAVGILLGMMLAGRSARRIGLNPDAAWDAGLFAVVCCFVTSRLLLVATDFRAFLRYPLLLLSLPSLTFGGMVLAGLVVWLNLRRKQIPVAPLLDAFAPAAALLAAFLETGHLLDGSEPGMPIQFARNIANSPLWPVSALGAGLSLALAAILWAALGRRLPTGRIAALGLLLGGTAAFGLDMLSLPLEIASDLPLQPGQIVALAAILGGGLLWTFGTQQARFPRNPGNGAALSSS